jgi:hypothetical protein
MLSRRTLLGGTLATLWAAAAESRVVLNIAFVQDGHGHFKPGSLDRFWREIWPEAAVALGQCGISLETTWRTGEIRRSASSALHFTELVPHAINVVLTDHLQLVWDNGRALSGVATKYEGYTLCVLALDYAHANRVPFLSVNTCLHELMHVLAGDVNQRRSTRVFLGGQARESRVDAVATGLWLFGTGRDIVREQARAFTARA